MRFVPWPSFIMPAVTDQRIFGVTAGSPPASSAMKVTGPPSRTNIGVGDLTASRGQGAGLASAAAVFGAGGGGGSCPTAGTANKADTKKGNIKNRVLCILGNTSRRDTQNNNMNISRGNAQFT